MHIDGNGQSFRDLVKVWGIRFVFSVSGTAGKFSAVHFVLTLGSGIGLMGLVSIVGSYRSHECQEQDQGEPDWGRRDQLRPIFVASCLILSQFQLLGQAQLTNGTQLSLWIFLRNCCVITPHSRCSYPLLQASLVCELLLLSCVRPNNELVEHKFVKI